MSTTSNYPGGFNSVTIRGVPITQLHPGRVYWVNNSSVLAENGIPGSDSGSEGTYTQPFSTIDYAIGIATASRGDIIAVMPGYTQTITLATEFVMDKAGIAIVGLGTGSSRTTITLGAAAANIPITAANMSISNILFVNNFADVASTFTATGTATPTDLTIEGCEFRDTTSILNGLTVVTGNATANSLDGLGFLNNRISSLGTTAATTSIVLGSAVDRMSVNDNFGIYAILDNTACMIGGGANNMTNFEFARNNLFRPNANSTTGTAISSSSTACTGICHHNTIWQLDGSAGIWISTGTKLGFFENYSPITGAADKSGLINPAAV